MSVDLEIAQEGEQPEGVPAQFKDVLMGEVSGVCQREGDREDHTVPLPPSEEEDTTEVAEAGEKSVEEEVEEDPEEDHYEDVQDLHVVVDEVVDATEPHPEDKAEELRVMKAMLSAKMEEGETWYIVSRDWLVRWKEFTGFSYTSFGAKRPGRIDNSDLIDMATLSLKPRLFAEHDYTQIPEPAWRQFLAWYGGGPVIPRPVIVVGMSKTTKIETYPLGLQLVHNAKLDQPLAVRMSRSMTVGQLKKKGCKEFGVRMSKMRLYNFHVEIKGGELKDLTATLEAARVTDRSKILFEEEGVETPKTRTTSSYSTSYSSTAPYQSSYSGYKSSLAARGTPSASTASSSLYGSGSSGYSSNNSTYGTGYSSSYSNGRSSMAPYGYSSSFAPSSSYGSYSKPEAKGLTGLNNLGNTCFMNSALQCLSNTVVLRDFFLTDAFLADLNRTNPIGMGGKIADEYAALVKSVWEGDRSAVAPSRFKATLGQFAPQFSGFAQQDAQELLAFLLDGLHEDLNRIKNKPATNTVESDGREDSLVAREAWEVYKKRNDSVVVDNFVGQYKSKLVCPVCPKVSVTFDPFMYLSLPLPEAATTVVRVTLLRFYSERPTEYALVVRRTATIAELRAKLAETAGVDTSRLPLAYVSRHEINRMFRDSDLVTEIRPTYLVVAMELPDESEEEAKAREEEEKSAKAGEEKKRKREERQRKKEEKQRRKEEKKRKKEKGERKREEEEEESENEREREEEAGEANAEPERESVTATAADTAGERLLPVTIKCVLPGGYFRTPREIGYPFILPVRQGVTTAGMLAVHVWYRVGHLFKRSEEEESDDEEEEDSVIMEKASSRFELKILSGSGFHATYAALDDLSAPVVLAKDVQALVVTLKSEAVVKDIAEAAMRKIEDESVRENGTRQEAAKKRVQLADCLDTFVQEEVLSPTDPWYCPDCKEMRQAAKTMFLYSLPDVLIIHLKRFKYTRHHRDKLQTVVDFPIEGLDISDYLPPGKGAVYDLFAVSNHLGGMGGGHYTAYAKNSTTGDWYEFDDSRVKKASESALVSEWAYLLFYVRRGASPQ